MGDIADARPPQSLAQRASAAAIPATLRTDPEAVPGDPRHIPIRRLQRAAGNRAVVRLLAGDGQTVQRHTGSAPVGAEGPVDYPGVGPDPDHLDHESRALRHQLVDRVSNFKTRPKSGLANAAWVRAQLPELAAWKKFHAHQSQLTALVDFLNTSVVNWSTQFWDVYGVKDGWAAAIAAIEAAGASPLATAYGTQVRNFNFAPEQPPAALLPSTQNASTGAFWEYTRRAIFVSKALTDPVEMLGAILFECENVKREAQYGAIRKNYDPKIKGVDSKMADTNQPKPRAGDKPWKQQLGDLKVDRGKAVAGVEFEVDRANQLKLQAAHGVADQLQLCQALGVPANLLGQNKPYVAKQPLALPARTELRGQEARNALWWYWAGLWNNDVRAKEIWEITNHSEVFGATASLYG